MKQEEIDLLFTKESDVIPALKNEHDLRPLFEFVNYRKKLMLLYTDSNPVLNIQNEGIKHKLSIIFKQKTVVDDIIEDLELLLGIEDLKEFSYEELNDFVGKTLFTWFDPSLYGKDLLKISSIFICFDCGNEMSSVFDEARKCYAFQQYNACAMLCRLLLERFISILLDNCNNAPLKNKYNEYDYYKCMRYIFKDNHEYYDESVSLRKHLNAVVHGKYALNGPDAETVLLWTIKIIEGMAIYKIDVEA